MTVKSIIFFIITTLWSTTQCGPLVSKKIINGTEINISEVPYQVHFNPYCGGSILTKQHIVTAAHCSGSKIRAGSSDKANGGQEIEVLRKIDHPKYKKINGAASYDFALLVLAEELVFNDNVQSIALARGPVPDGTVFLVSGWGVTRNPSDDQNLLRALKVPKINFDDCQKMYEDVDMDESMMCARYVEGGKDVCSGDSGGPLVFNKTLYGVVSWSVPCALPGFPAVYGYIPEVYDWYMSLIQNTV